MVPLPFLAQTFLAKFVNQRELSQQYLKMAPVLLTLDFSPPLASPLSTFSAAYHTPPISYESLVSVEISFDAHLDICGNIGKPSTQ